MSPVLGAGLSGNARVTTAHVQQLAALQEDVAAQIKSATRVTNGIGHSVWVNHGATSGPSNTATDQVETTRRAAGEALPEAARLLASKLRTAATAYHNTDQHKANNLHDQLR